MAKSIDRILGRRPKVIEAALNERVYAIGDVHGRYDLLREIMSKIVAHWEGSTSKPQRIQLIFLGDIIDRGPDSDRCLRLVTKLSSLPGVTLIRGNHEDLLLRSIEGDQQAQSIWLANGGDATLGSFGIDPPQTGEDPFDFGERIVAAIPETELAALKKAPTHTVSGDYFFAHAGVRPGVPLKKQTDFDLFFIRDEFIQSDDWHGAMIVHGHSLTEEVELLDNRIGVDTGAYRTNRLSCICLEGRTRKVIATG